MNLPATTRAPRGRVDSTEGAIALHGGGALVAVELCLTVYCVLNVITTPDEVRNLPKLLWLLLVLLFPFVGAVAWFVAGRPQGSGRSLPYKGNTGRVPAEYDRPGRATAASPGR